MFKQFTIASAVSTFGAFMIICTQTCKFRNKNSSLHTNAPASLTAPGPPLKPLKQIHFVHFQGQSDQPRGAISCLLEALHLKYKGSSELKVAFNPFSPMQWSVQIWITSHGKHYLLSVPGFLFSICGRPTMDVFADHSHI